MKTKRITTLAALLISSVIVALTPVSALDISGSYDDKGTVIRSESGGGSETISFHGMLSLDFDPIMAEAKYGDTTHIDLIDKDGKLDIEATLKDVTAAGVLKAAGEAVGLGGTSPAVLDA